MSGIAPNSAGHAGLTADIKETMVPDAERRRALLGSAVGSTIEWYDYFLYGTMASIIFAKQFFPSTDPLVSQLLALAAFALAFVIRPLGGVIFAHVGDRVGRKKTLAITLSMMGMSTVCMGLLPNYDQIGVWAPILLSVLRLMQGLALGGEWGGGVLLAVEYSPRHRRGFFGAVPQTGAVLGLALGNIITSLLSNTMSDADFQLALLRLAGGRLLFADEIGIGPNGEQVNEPPQDLQLLIPDGVAQPPVNPGVF